MVIIETSTWQQIKAGVGASARDKLAAATVNNKIYFFGGFGPKLAENLDSTAEQDSDDGFEDEDDDNEDEEPMAEFGWFNDLFSFDTGM